jgi:hypothetical protein
MSFKPVNGELAGGEEEEVSGMTLREGLRRFFCSIEDVPRFSFHSAFCGGESLEAESTNGSVRPEKRGQPAGAHHGGVMR